MRIVSTPISCIRRFSLSRTRFQDGVPTAGATDAKALDGNVPALKGERKEPSGPVGPGAAKDGKYKIPEYFCYSKWFFTEAEVEMQKYRCPQPNALKK